MTAGDLKPADAGRQETKTLRIALLGCGSVGSQVARLLQEQADDLAVRTGARLELAGIAVRRPAHPRAAGIDRDLLTADAGGLATRPDVDIVVEVIGGIEPARSLLLAAMKAGKSVVTANKALLAENGAEIHGAAREHGTDLYYEAAVAGAIPLLRPLRESLAGDTVHRVLGIVNGTTNYILDRMDSSGAGFTEALEEAQSMGYAEADPTADVEGFDAAAKAAILAGLAFHTEVTAADVHREGITDVTTADMASARALGCVVKLLAICEQSGGGVSVRVHPAMIPRSHPLASVGGAYNAVFVEAASAGRSCSTVRARAVPRPPARCSAISSQWLGTGWPAPAGPTRRPTRRCPSCRWGRRSPATTSRSTSPTGRACWLRWPTRSPATTCPSARPARRPVAMTRS